MKNRANLARCNAGLSIGQAAKYLGLTSDEVAQIEESDEAFDMADHAKLADVYGVNIPWLKGDVARHDYAAMKKTRGFDELESSRDKAVLAEFAASMPRNKRPVS